MADAADSKSAEGNLVRVRLSPRALCSATTLPSHGRKVAPTKVPVRLRPGSRRRHQDLSPAHQALPQPFEALVCFCQRKNFDFDPER
jgi:hypothetical protein